MTVQIPRGQTVDPDDIGTPLTIGNAELAFMVPVKYYDKLGKPHQEFVFVVGNTVYKDPSGENWAAKLKVLNDPIQQEVVSRTASAFQQYLRKMLAEMGITPGMPSGRDEVDVLADETDKDVSPAAE